MILFFEVTAKSGGGYFARCHRMNFETNAASLLELRDNIMSGMHAELGLDAIPPMRDIKLVVTRE